MDSFKGVTLKCCEFIFPVNNYKKWLKGEFVCRNVINTTVAYGPKTMYGKRTWK